jgi:hypothetical protein
MQPGTGASAFCTKEENDGMGLKLVKVFLLLFFVGVLDR